MNDEQETSHAFARSLSNAWLADDSWKIAKRTKKGIVHLWRNPSRHGNQDFFRSECNITARRDNYRDSTMLERENGCCRKCLERAAANDKLRGE